MRFGLRDQSLMRSVDSGVDGDGGVRGTVGGNVVVVGAVVSIGAAVGSGGGFGAGASGGSGALLGSSAGLGALLGGLLEGGGALGIGGALRFGLETVGEGEGSSASVLDAAGAGVIGGSAVSAGAPGVPATGGATEPAAAAWGSCFDTLSWVVGQSHHRHNATITPKSAARTHAARARDCGARTDRAAPTGPCVFS